MSNSEMCCYAACSFGLEAVVADELRHIGIEKIDTRDARVYFRAGADELARANLWLRSADRVYVVLKEFTATTFEELFEGIKALRWHEWLPRDARFPVAGDSVRSVLKSVPDIQSIAKKAVVEALKREYGLSFFKESGTEYGIYIAILADKVSVCLNSSGNGLNRRGYRVKNGPAPLRETLAAGIISISRWHGRPFYDPMCGSGTIAIEAALMAANMAPGIKRSFGAASWNDEFSFAFSHAKEHALDSVKRDIDTQIFAGDINGGMVEMARFHARRAGVDRLISYEKADICAFSPATEAGSVIINPPYAIRMGEKEAAHKLYGAIGRRFIGMDGFKLFAICADDEFERCYGKNADKKRKLYNGNIKCCFYQYFK